MYLLLRNNKQSGPHSLDELKSMGLKAYDLVWSEGRSAAWRYPCEIEELKPFAPQVEEQPFDRFYKRTPVGANVTANVSSTANVTANVSSGGNASTSPIPVTVESTRNPGKRIIYVTMPAARNTSAPAIQREPVRESMGPVREGVGSMHESVRPIVQPAQAVQPMAAQSEGVPPVAAPAVRENNILEEYYPSQQNLGHEPAVEYSPRSAHAQSSRGARRASTSVRPVRLLLVGSCILALLAAGIFIGLNLNKDTLGINKDAPGSAKDAPASANDAPASGVRVVARIPPTNADQPDPHSGAQTLPASAATSPAVPSNDSLAAINKKAVGSQQPPNRNGVVPAAGSPTTEGKATPRLPGAKTQKEKLAHPINQANSLSPTKDSAAGQSDVAHAVHQSDVIETKNKNNGTSRDNLEITDKEAVKTALASQVSVGANGYSVGTFGGITDLQLTVTNRSVYPLDLVIVEVQYIQANKKVFKTENLYFHGIGAGSALMLEAPRSSRGVKVQYRITAMSSKELGLSYSGI
jgi:hypothetical protein